MRISDKTQCIITLRQLHQDLAQDPCNKDIIAKITAFLDANGEFFKDNISLAIELDSMALKVKSKSNDYTLVEKIKGCVKQILPDASGSREQSLNMLRDEGNFEQIQEWIELMEISVEELPLSIHELYRMLRNETREESIPELLSWQSLGQIIKHFESRDGALNESTKRTIFKIVHGLVRSSRWNTAKNVHESGITSQEVLVEAAKFCAQNKGWDTEKNIKLFGITSQVSLIEVAKICIQNGSDELARNFKNFEIVDPNARAEIAKLNAQCKGGQTAEHFKNFDIEDPQTRIEIAMLCAKNNYTTAMYIKNFEIADPKVEAEIIKLCAQQSARLAWDIHKLKIADPNLRAEIAKLCAINNGEITAMQFKNFDIEDPQTRIEIAMLCANQSGWMAKFVKNFKIADPQVRAQIAILCARQNAAATAEFFSEFEIEDPMVRAEIALLCAQRDAKATAKYFKNFNIENPQVRAKISRLCAQQAPKETETHIASFEIEDDRMRFRIFLDCFKVNELSNMSTFRPFPQEVEKIIQAIYILQSGEKHASEREQLYSALHDYIQGMQCQEKSKVQLQAICHHISQLDPHMQQFQAVWFINAILLLTASTPHAVEWIMEQGVLSDLNALRDFSLKEKLTREFVQLAESTGGRIHWEAFLMNMPQKKGVRLLAAPLFALEVQGIAKEQVDKILAKVLKPQIMKDTVKVQRILHTTYLLASTELLNTEEKAQALDKIFLEAHDIKQMLDNAMSVKGLLLLKNTTWLSAKDDLRSLFRACFENAIPLEGFEGDVALRYDQTFASSRNPDAILTYAAGLQKTFEPQLLQCLGRYVVSVFDRTFKKMRYDTKDNPHLTKLFGARPDLKEKWERSSELSLQLEAKVNEGEAEAFNTEKWLRTKLLNDDHLSGEDLTYVKLALEATNDEARKAVKKDLTLSIAERIKSSKKSKLDRDPAFLNLKLQLSCLNLLLAGNDHSLTKLDKLFDAIGKSLRIMESQAEFVHDVKGILDNLEKPTALIKETVHVVITDDPIDLLLAGTDVSGSCQRVDGDPELNKGLLGYILDGKNQILAIKDRNGRIIARAMISLVWDGENPVLYRERFYPETTSIKEKASLNQLLMQLAESLEVPLAVEGDEGDLYGCTLQTFGGPAPYEYSDSGGGITSKGIYTIESARLMTVSG